MGPGHRHYIGISKGWTHGAGSSLAICLAACLGYRRASLGATSSCTTCQSDFPRKRPFTSGEAASWNKHRSGRVYTLGTMYHGVEQVVVRGGLMT